MQLTVVPILRWVDHTRINKLLNATETHAVILCGVERIEQERRSEVFHRELTFACLQKAGVYCPKKFCDPRLLVDQRELEFLQLERRPVDCWRQIADRNLDGPVHESVAHHQERQKLRQGYVPFRPYDHCVGRADAIHLRHCQLALVCAPTPEDDIALVKA